VTKQLDIGEARTDPSANRAVRDEMDALATSWIAELPCAPPGNAGDGGAGAAEAGWAGAIDGDDWAGVAPAPAAPAVSSPFAGDGAAERVGAGGDDSDDEDDEDRPAELERGFLELTRDNVDKVLDEVRPYLIADGGNIVVADVDADARVITLALQGACGSCASSTTTMKMGVERVIHENFLDVAEVVEVSDLAGALSYKAVDDALKQIKDAVIAMDGKVEVASVDAASGAVELRFKGPSKVRFGIEAVVRDVEDVKEVTFVEFE